MKDIYSSQKLLSYGLSWGCRRDRMVVGLIKVKKKKFPSLMMSIGN
jgi:hypothetical protein